MILASLLLSAAASGGEADVHYVDATLYLDGELCDARFVDVDGDGRVKFVVAVYLPDQRRRELRIHDWTSEGTIEPTASQVVPILTDVVAYTFADVRDEPGPELVFLTRGGAHSYSLRKEGLRGNIARLAVCDLVYTVPDARALAWWPYTLRRANRDHILLPEPSAFSIWGPRADGEDADPREGSYRRLSLFSEAAREHERFDAVAVGGPGVQIRIDGREHEEMLLAQNDSHGSTFFSFSTTYSAPALADVDGDGALDLLVLDDQQLSIYSSGATGETPVRVETVPEYLQLEDKTLTLVLEDIDQDGDIDFFARIEEEETDDFANAEITVAVLLNDGARMFPEKPQQFLKFETSQLRLRVTDVDGDGRTDLFVREVNLPNLLAVATGFKFEIQSTLHLGRRGGGFERKPVLKQTRTVDENGIQTAIAQRVLEYDCSGDGIADMIEVDLTGQIAIRRIVKESGLFSGDSWRLENSPWKSFETTGNIGAMKVGDWNADGLGDVYSAADDQITIYLSRRGGGRR